MPPSKPSAPPTFAQLARRQVENLALEVYATPTSTDADRAAAKQFLLAGGDAAIDVTKLSNAELEELILDGASTEVFGEGRETDWTQVPSGVRHTMLRVLDAMEAIRRGRLWSEIAKQWSDAAQSEHWCVRCDGPCREVKTVTTVERVEKLIEPPKPTAPVASPSPPPKPERVDLLEIEPRRADLIEMDGDAQVAAHRRTKQSERELAARVLLKLEAMYPAAHGWAGDRHERLKHAIVGARAAASGQIVRNPPFSWRYVAAELLGVAVEAL